MDMVAYYEGWLGACREMQKFIDYECKKIDNLETKDMFAIERMKALSTMRIALIEVQTQPICSKDDTKSRSKEGTKQ